MNNNRGPLKVRDLINKLSVNGCTYVNTNGSHMKWKTPNGKTIVVVGNKKNADATEAVITSVRRTLRQEGIDI